MQALLPTVRRIGRSWYAACAEHKYLSAPQFSESDALDRLAAHEYHAHGLRLSATGKGTR
jgi:hypothetical protein